MPVTELKHPIVRHHLTRLRDMTATAEMFRLAIRRLSVLVGCEAFKDLTTKPAAVQTPIGSAEGHRIAERVAIVPILRAGLLMLDSMLELLPEAEVWHLGLYRDESSLKPVTYYNKVPRTNPVDTAVVLDPMLATGGSVCHALNVMKQWGVRRLKVLGIIGSPEGVDQVTRQFPEAQIVLGAIDLHLNAKGFIVPGLGDAGDRAYNAIAKP